METNRHEGQELLDQSRILNPDTELADGGLPEDLWNSTNALTSAMRFYEEGVLPEAQLRELLKNARTFDGYYAGQVEKYNKSEVRVNPDFVPYDVQASIDAQRNVIEDKDVIARFDEKIMQLRQLADGKEIDKKQLGEIIREEIRSLIYGDKQTRLSGK